MRSRKIKQCAKQYNMKRFLGKFLFTLLYMYTLNSDRKVETTVRHFFLGGGIQNNCVLGV